MASNSGTLVASTNKSLVNRDGRPLQRLEADAALLSEMQTEPLFCENSQTILILVALLHGITENTTSGDVIALATYRARDMCLQAGIDEELFRRVVTRFGEYAKKTRAWNPLAF